MSVGAPSLGYARRDSPFIGRTDQLDRLGELLAGAAEGVPATLFVSGEAGVGKSRLLGEFARQARHSGAQVLWGSCLALGTGELPYAPLIEALRRLTREVGQERVRELAGPGYRELAGLFDATADAPPQRPADGSSAQRVFRAVLHLLDNLGEDRPVVLVVEDLHWADQPTLDLLSYLTRLRTTERQFLIGTYRTTDPIPDHRLRTLVAELDRARRIEQMEIARFDKAELKLFLRATTRAETPYVLVERAFELSDGNPFFVEELLAANALTVIVPEGPVRLPGSVRDVVLSRYELLGDDAREVMRVAATAGRRVSHRLLAAVVAMTPQRLLAALRECVDRQMLIGVAGEDTYVFRHALVREVVHEDLLNVERVAQHGAVAAALAADSQLSYAGGLMVAAELSYHWFEAQAYPQALVAAVQAGDDAMRLSAFREAGQQYERALAVWFRVDHPAERAGLPLFRLLAKTAAAARWAGGIDRAVELARQAVAEVDSAREPVLAGERYERLGSFLWDAGDRGASEEAYAEAVRLLVDAPPSATVARVLAARASILVHQGQFSDGLKMAQQALDMAAAVDDAEPERGRALGIAGLALAMLGDVDAGLEALRGAVQIADAVEQIEDLYRAYGNLVFALQNAGRLEESVDIALEGLGRARQRGLDHTRVGSVLANNASAALVDLGRWDEAIDITDELLRDRPLAETLFPLLTRAEVAVFRGDFVTAATLLAQARTAGGAIRQPQFIGTVYAATAEMAIWQSQYEVAREAVAEGLRALRGTEHRGVLLRLYWLGIRNEADERLRRSALPGTSRPDLASFTATLAGLAGEVDSLQEGAPGPALPDVTALLLLCRAEHDRSGATGTSPRWAEVADAWDALNRPYPTAYARWREAEDAVHRRRKDVAQQAAQAAYRRATELRAEPLHGEIAALTLRARITLTAEQAGPQETPPRTKNPFGLTRRELAILERLMLGHTDARIARELYIAPKTVGNHVSSILRKLRVSKRGEAAAVAHQHGLKANEPTV